MKKLIIYFGISLLIISCQKDELLLIQEKDSVEIKDEYNYFNAKNTTFYFDGHERAIFIVPGFTEQELREYGWDQYARMILADTIISNRFTVNLLIDSLGYYEGIEFYNSHSDLMVIDSEESKVFTGFNVIKF